MDSRHNEPLRVTLVRTGAIALVIGAVLAWKWGRAAYWPAATLLALWPAFGGHWVELWYLNWLRPRLPVARGIRTAARVGVWFIGGIGLGWGMRLTAMALGGRWPMRTPTWWVAGLGFIGIELVAHLVLALRGCPSVYNGRG